MERRALDTSSNSAAAGDLEKDGTRMLLLGDDGDYEFLNQLKAEALIPLKEDLAIWLNGILGPELDINVENFLERLDDGVHLCRLAEIIEAISKETKVVQSGKHEHKCETKSSLPKSPLCRKNATKGSWLARDNTANFISWCRSVGVKPECLFETEGLVLHRDPRNVILCLLDLARIGSQFGLELPNILKLEKEIELEEQESKTAESQAKAKMKTPKKTVPPTTSDELDKQVTMISGKCCCKASCNQLKKLSDGRYRLGKKILYVRLLNDRHLMVRVGGGWDSLEHYLAVHDPCRIKEFRHIGDGDSFPLHSQSQHKARQSK